MVWWSETEWQWGWRRRRKVERIRGGMRGEGGEEQRRDSCFVFFEAASNSFSVFRWCNWYGSKRKVDHEGDYSLLKKALVSFPI